jgi:hypothetical protein
MKPPPVKTVSKSKCWFCHLQSNPNGPTPGRMIAMRLCLTLDLSLAARWQAWSCMSGSVVNSNVSRPTDLAMIHTSHLC